MYEADGAVEGLVAGKPSIDGRLGVGSARDHGEEEGCESGDHFLAVLLHAVVLLSSLAYLIERGVNELNGSGAQL